MLTLSAFQAYAAVIGAAQRGARVAYLLSDGAVLIGTARRVCTNLGHIAHPEAPVDELWLEIALDLHVEPWRVPLAELVIGYAEGSFVVDYVSPAPAVVHAQAHAWDA